MIKNKVLDIKIIFKIYLKILKINLKYSKFSNRLLFYKTLKNSLKKCSRKLFFKTILKNSYQISPKLLLLFYISIVS